MTKDDWKDLITAITELRTEVRTLSREMGELKHAVVTKVSRDDDYGDMCTKVSKLWDWKNKISGQIIAYTSIAGGLGTLFVNILIEVIRNRL